nr:cyclophilin-like fold protein [Mediterraneibacter glycyrrhizinilyticus]
MLSLVACSRENVPSENETITTETENTQTEAEKNESEDDQNTQADTNTDSTEAVGQEAEMKLQIEAGGSTFTATLEDNEAVTAFVEMLEDESIVIEMDDYSGFEKVGSLGTSLPASNSQMTTQAGDIVLYNSSQIVMFYGSNSWSYTKLAEVDDLTGWEDALGSGSVTVTFSIEQ